MYLYAYTSGAPANECPGDAENLAMPTLMIEAAEGAMMIADPALLANVYG